MDEAQTTATGAEGGAATDTGQGDRTEDGRSAPRDDQAAGDVGQVRAPRTLAPECRAPPDPDGTRVYTCGMRDVFSGSVRPLDPHDPDDRRFAVGLFQHVPMAGYPTWYAPEQLAAREREVAEGVLGRLGVGSTDETVLVAITPAGQRAGIVWVTTISDHFTRLPSGHVEDVATAPGYEGQGVGGALMAAAESWARARGYAALTLNVWPANARARALYARLGFADEIVRMKKLLPGGDGPDPGQ
jgi:ribosomal protein S18 acetylase RimI-like enzyme